MGREFAKLHCSMSDDPDFNALTAEAQLVYFRLTIRPQLSRVGVTTAAPALVASQTGLDAAAVAEALDELDRARFVIIDADTGELLVRAKLRYSGYSNSKHETGALAEADLVLSALIRQALVVEARRIGWDWTHLSPTSPQAGLAVPDTQSDTQPEALSDSALSDSLSSELCISEPLKSEEIGRAPQPAGLARPKRPRARDPVWDALVDVFGDVTNKADRSKRNAAAGLLRETLDSKHVPPEQHGEAVRQLCEAYRHKFPRAAFTPNAVATNPDLLIGHIQGRNKPVPTQPEVAGYGVVG